MNDGQLTVAELIELLRQQPQDALVCGQSYCGDTGAAGGVRYDRALHEVFIEAILEF